MCLTNVTVVAQASTASKDSLGAWTRDAFQAPFKNYLPSCPPVLDESAADFRLLRELSFLMFNECVWDACLYTYLTHLGVFKVVWMCL